MIRDRGLNHWLPTYLAETLQRYRLRQIASLVPSVTHPDPDREATRLVARAAMTGFDRLRDDNRKAWLDLWRGLVVVTADDPRWQQ